MGFEPTIPISRDNGFQDRRIRPLCHLSEYFNNIKCARSFSEKFADKPSLRLSGPSGSASYGGQPFTQSALRFDRGPAFRFFLLTLFQVNTFSAGCARP